MLVGKHSFTWDPNTKGRTMRLSNGNLTVRKNSMETEYDGCFGTFPMSQDTHYWEIKIVNFLDLNDIMIGVSTRNSSDGRSRIFEKFWGWHCTRAQKLRPIVGTSRPDVHEYGPHCKINDTIGVLLQFKNG